MVEEVRKSGNTADCDQDKTGRKKTEEELKFQADLLQNIPDALAATDENFVITYWNRAAEKLFGWKATEVIGKPSKEIFQARVPGSPQEDAIATMLATGNYCGEVYCHRKDGSEVLTEVRTAVLRGLKGEFKGTTSIIRDITERKRAEEALTKYKNELEIKVEERTDQILKERLRLYNLLETLPVYIILLDKDYHVSFANKYFRERFGEEYGKRCYEYLFNRIEPCNNCETYQVMKTGLPHYWEWLGPDGRNYDIHDHPFIDSDGSTLILEMGIDITERKKMEKSLQKSNKDLDIAFKQLQQYAKKITQVQEEERKRIAYELHDDTAQYLSILKMQIGALAESAEIRSPKVKQQLQYLEKDADRAFNDVRRYSHELRPTTLEHQGLVGALEQIADDFNKLGQLSVGVHVEGMEPELSEEVKLGFFRIAQEALNNTRKHSKANQADIDLQFNHEHICMMVRDNGNGFDTKQGLKKSCNQGSLGLMSMRERAGLIGAKLSIESKPGNGTTVRVDWPL